MALAVAAAVGLLFVESGGQAAGYRGPRFEDVATARGLSFVHLSTEDKRYIIESMSGGAGLLDCDHDGRLDVILAAGSSVARYRSGRDLMAVLYRQDAAGHFERAALPPRPGPGWGMGVAAADFDGDGETDVYVTGYGGNVLYRNRGGCVFEDATARAGVAASGFSTGAAWADYDRDGHVDLFVSRYVHVDMNALPEFGKGKTCTYRGLPVQCGPFGMAGETDSLFRNRGDGTFEDVSRRAGVEDADRRNGMGVVWGDYDDDGWPDLFVANDAGENYLYRNNRDGTFTDVALALGVALSGDGVPLGNMGADFGDFDRDGRLDIFDTTFENQDDMLYRNLGRQGFAEVSRRAGVAPATTRLVKWGTSFADFDNDGWLDLLVATGHVLPQVDRSREGFHYRQPLVLHMNRGDGTFTGAGEEAGLRRLPLASRRGAAFGDVDGDGSVDVLLLNVGEAPSLLLNRLENGNHWIAFELAGTRSNRAAIGARVTVRAGALAQVAEVRGGSGYLSQNDLRLHFGLGDRGRADVVEIAWPSGAVDRLGPLSADRRYRVEEGSAGPAHVSPLGAP